MASVADADALKLDVLYFVRQARSQHGLAHSDYPRYRRFCSSAIQRLRTRLKFKQGRNRYQKKELKLEFITDVRWLQMLLLDAERAGARAHELKASMERTGEIHANRRRNMLRRFAKASKVARAVAALAEATADERTVVEAAAYADHTQALEWFEKESDPYAAACHLKRAQDLLTVLATTGGPNSKAAAAARRTEVGELMRLLVAEASRRSGRAVQPVAPDLSARATDCYAELCAAAGEPAAADGGDAMEVDGDTRAPAAAGRSWAWRGRPTQVVDATAHAALLRGDGVVAAARAAEAARDWATVRARLDEGVAALREALAAFDEAAGGLHSDSAEAVAMARAAAAELEVEQKAAQALQIFDSNHRQLAGSLAGIKVKVRGARPQDGVRLFHSMRRAAAQLHSLADDPAMPAPLVQHLVALASAAAPAFVAASLAFLARRRLAAGDAATATAFLQEAHSQLAEADDAEFEWGSLLGALVRRVRGDVRAFERVCQARAMAVEAEVDGEAAAQAAPAEAAARGEGGGVGGQAAADGGGFAQDHLQEWRSFAAFAGGSQCKARLFRLNSLFQTAALKPHVLDLAIEAVEAPDVASRASAAGQGSGQAPPKEDTIVQGFKRFLGLGG